MKWGPWSIDAKHLTLVHEHYEVSFRDCTSSAAILDWIFQIQGKTWADKVTMFNLLKAFDDVLHPQENYCGGGVDHQVDGGALAQRYIDNPRERDELLASFGHIVQGSDSIDPER